jgi:predicted acyl esterase
MSDPLPRDVIVAGPIMLTLYAAIDQEDTNWIVVLKDVGPDVSVRTAREGERNVPPSLPERELTRGWLKASYRALDEKRSKPWEPFHKLTRDAVAPVKPEEVVEYRIQILATANQFKAGHRICLDITSMDVPTGTGAMTQRRVHSVPRLQQQDRYPQDLSGTRSGHRICCCRSYLNHRSAFGLTSGQRRKGYNDDDPI